MRVCEHIEPCESMEMLVLFPVEEIKATHVTPMVVRFGRLAPQTEHQREEALPSQRVRELSLTVLEGSLPCAPQLRHGGQAGMAGLSRGSTLPPIMVTWMEWPTYTIRCS